MEDYLKKRRKTHDVNHACRAGGCSIREAILLYIGVRIGSWQPVVTAWREASTNVEGPQLVQSAADARLEADFRLIAEQVIALGEIDEPLEIEARTDEAMTLVTGIDLN